MIRLRITHHVSRFTFHASLELLAALLARCRCPVVAEGCGQTPAELAQACALGAHAVVIGGAITRPQDITRRFVQALPAALAAPGA